MYLKLCIRQFKIQKLLTHKNLLIETLSIQYSSEAHDSQKLADWDVKHPIFFRSSWLTKTSLLIKTWVQWNLETKTTLGTKNIWFVGRWSSFSGCLTWNMKGLSWPSVVFVGQRSLFPGFTVSSFLQKLSNLKPYSVRWHLSVSSQKELSLRGIRCQLFTVAQAWSI